MAKPKPKIGLDEMTRELGYDVCSLIQPGEETPRFYSDLTPAAVSVYGRTKREYEEHQRDNLTLNPSSRSSKHALCQQLDESLSISCSQHKVTIMQRSRTGFYRYSVDIHYDFGLHIPLIFTEDEAGRTISVANMRVDDLCSTAPIFSKLPREIRDKIYGYALPSGRWSIHDVDSFNKVTLTGSIGDWNGYYFPMSKHVGALSVNKLMRLEILPFVYRTTTFCPEDLDDLLKLLIAAGELGRSNIESLCVPWMSKSDLECKWEERPDGDDHFLTLPALHVTECVGLLKQCKRLRFLRLYFESELIDVIAPKIFKADRGIRELRSVQVENVEIWSLGHESLEHHPLVDWLRKGIVCSDC